MGRQILISIAAIVLITSCEIGEKVSSKQVIAFTGQPLPVKQLDQETHKDFDRKLKIAEYNLKKNPDSLELIIWKGRRLAYLGKFHQAIDVYSQGLKKHPASHKLRRHRGHRYITTRKLDLAIEDFDKAVFYCKNRPNAVEPDGLPNSLNQPLSNDQFNIWYHYGLALYLSGKYENAISAYRSCLEVSGNADLIIATKYWLYLSYKKAGKDQLADQLLVDVDPSLTLIENDAYLKMLLLFKDVYQEETLITLAQQNEDSEFDPTYAYGIGMWHLFRNNDKEGHAYFKKALKSDYWDAFGYLASEKEIANAKN